MPFIKRDEYYLLNIPMDAETPPGRYLRPQAMAEEYITRNFAFPVSYRMDLGIARSKDFKKEENHTDYGEADSNATKPGTNIRQTSSLHSLERPDLICPPKSRHNVSLFVSLSKDTNKIGQKII